MHHLSGTLSDSLIYRQIKSKVDKPLHVCFFYHLLIFKEISLECHQSAKVLDYRLRGCWLELRRRHYTWMKVFRITSEFRILRMTFHRKSSSKSWIREIMLASDLLWVCLRTIDHLNLKLWIFSGPTASFKIEISKVLEILNFHPWLCCVFVQDTLS